MEHTLSSLEIYLVIAKSLLKFGTFYVRYVLRQNIKLLEGAIGPALDEVRACPECISFISRREKASQEERESYLKKKSELMSEKVKFSPYKFNIERMPDSLSMELISTAIGDMELVSAIKGDCTVDALLDIFIDGLGCMEDDKAVK